MRQVSRRAVLRAAALGVVLAPFVSARQAFAATTTTGRYARSRFIPMRGGTFTMAGATGAWSAKLNTISDLPSAAAGDDRRFGLTFRTSVAGPPQGTYTFRRPGFTATTLFVVPGDASHRSYQAIINRVS
jgi:hypothetical protein